MRQPTLLLLLFTCYFLLTMNRRAFQFAIPMVESETWINKTDIGIILSMQTSGYTISKFISGIAVDHFDSRSMLLLCVFASSIITVLLALSRLVWLSCLLALISGLILGMSWPCVGKILRINIPVSNFGFAWVLISCSMNCASMVGPMTTTFIAHYSHWTISFIGIACVSFAFALVTSSFLFSDSCPSRPVGAAGGSDDNNANQQPSLYDIAFNSVILSISLGYFAISTLRFTASDWMPLFLTQERGFSQVFASGLVSVMETGGVVGSFMAIRASDAYIRKKPRCNNPRLPCILILSMIACNATYLMAKHADSEQKLLMTFTAFFLGVSIYGPVSLYGVAAIESVPKSVSGASHTFVALAANIGAILAGYPISALSTYIGWSATFYFLILLLSVSGVVLFFARDFRPLLWSPKID